MGWFSDVTNFLSSPGFRIGSGIAGLAAGAGAFEGLGDFGEALTYGAGAANLASGAASTFGPNRSAFDRATGALQMGLGGYNLFQNETTLPFGAGSVGGYGSFGTVFDRLTNPDQYQEFSFYRPAVDYAAGGQPHVISMSQSITPSLSDGMPSGVADGSGNLTPTPLSDDEVRQGITGAPLAPMRPQQLPGATVPRSIETTAPLALPAAAAADTGGAGATIAPVAEGGRPMIGNLPVVGFTPNGQAIVSQGGRLFSAPIPAYNGGAGGVSGFIDRVINYASNNPLQATMGALQIGGMLVSLFGRSQADIAREAMERMDPSSPNAAEFRRLYEERARRDIDRQYEEVKSTLTAQMAGRGMLRSTVYTTALDQLERSRVDLTANLPYNSLVAWNQVAQAQGAGMRSAAGYAQVAAPQLDFSNMTRVLAQSPMTQALAAR